MSDDLLLDNIKNIYRKIAHSASRAGRSPEEVKLIAVTKTVNAVTLRKAIHFGLKEFGENKVQEAKQKISEPSLHGPDSGVTWHLIGHLQKNKAKVAVQLFDMIQSVDSLELAEKINGHAENMGKIQRILVQVKLSGESYKYGIYKSNLQDILGAVRNMKYLKLEGLMTMPPFFDNSEKARPFFKELRMIRDEAEDAGFSLPELSMGMTNDFEVAIQEGATMVRVGTGIFGERSY
jgi:pyridoxal phosphate enzyme (YggS family)